MILAEFIYGLDKYLVDRSLDGLAQGTVQAADSAALLIPALWMVW